MSADTKRWLQIIGGVLMFASISGGERGFRWEPNPKMFGVGVLVFLSTFITWKRNGNDDDDDPGTGSGA